ncbi:hypothetical protein F3Y22_tig00112925pilonHSYRG00241 [Hibiscus syriacus]|uniref:Uncharacterized protein n=1 Tax=Hibiscus syriacus TaxID=106335 RepID=A0A6A2XNT9_HIBSY|nr:uncharacterized protein LOC120184611 [Hibiscus syriacus]KAE8663686.1 hypothetical protein F3Y22_tig00112925pilonHSYRG00241 [Hibiscus syriacus]
MSQYGAYPSSEDSDSSFEICLSYDDFPFGDTKLLDLVVVDNKDAFVQRIKKQRKRSELHDAWYQSKNMLSSIFYYISARNAVKCATALLAGETGLDVDINALHPVLGSNPLYFTSGPPELIDLYIRNGARTDIRHKGMLPLNRFLDYIRRGHENIDWSSKQSICMVIVFLCLDMEKLESLRLLFENTKEVEKEVYHYMKGGKLVETTALLMIAREEITSPVFFKDFTSSGSMSLHQLVLLEIEALKASQMKLDSTSEEIHELKNKLETMNSMLCLIKVLQSVGPEIDQYRQDLPKLSMEELATKVAYLLISKGFVEYEDLKRFRPVSDETLPTSHQHFLKSLGSKLHGKNEGSQLESKDVGHVTDAMGNGDQSASLVKNHHANGVSSKHDGREKELADMLEEKNRPLGAVQANHELQIKQLNMELEKECDKLGNLQMRLQEEHKLNESLQEELGVTEIREG